jgi:hypothetical protein
MKDGRRMRLRLRARRRVLESLAEAHAARDLQLICGVIAGTHG